MASREVVVVVPDIICVSCSKTVPGEISGIYQNGDHTAQLALKCPEGFVALAGETILTAQDKDNRFAHKRLAICRDCFLKHPSLENTIATLTERI
jgi:hypothetical protein